MSSFNPSIEDLPPNVMTDVLSRLPVKTIIHCKCVCKNWRELVSDSYFVNLHLSRSPAGIMIHDYSSPHKTAFLYMDDPGVIKWWEIEDETRLHHDPVMNFDLNLITKTFGLLGMGSVNGLVCLGKYLYIKCNICICNPVTSEYTILPLSQRTKFTNTMIVYGFGIGLLTKEYKVIQIFQGDISLNATSSRPRLLEAEVYTLGKGQWRQLGHVPYRLEVSHGTFLNGSIHWIVLDEDSPEKLYAFDIDNETFQLFPSPPKEKLDYIRYQTLGVVNGCLSQCYTSYSEFTVWVMKEYGIRRSWHKEVVIKQTNLVYWWMDQPVSLLEGSKDGTILMLFSGVGLLVYCPRKKIFEKRESSQTYFTGIAYRPSFLKLQAFEL
ncbi:F-box associated domain containing protein [Tanacetum coccineum]